MKPQKAFFLLPLLICLGIGVYLLATFLLPSLNASPTTSDPVELGTKIVSPTAVSDFLAGRTVYDSPDALPDVTVDEVKAELIALEEINLAYVRRPGWWHIVKRTWRLKDEIIQNRDQDETTEWEVADMLPPVQIYDRWLQIVDEEGTFGKADLTVFSDEEGNPVQVLVLDEEGYGGNLTTMEHELPEYMETPPEIAAEIDALPPKKADSELRETIEWLDAIRYISEIEAGLIQNNGDEAFFLRIQTHVQGEPYKMEWLPEPVVGFILTYRIDPITGNLIEMTDVAVGESGTTYLELTETLLVSERYDEMPEDTKQLWRDYMERYWELVESQGEWSQRSSGCKLKDYP
jgi:hypothetical protein